MALTAQLVAVGMPGPAGHEALEAAAVALAAAGVAIGGRLVVEDDEAALEQALAAPLPLTLVVTGPAGTAGDVTARVLARAAGLRLVLSERMLAALEAHQRRQGRALSRRAERLALLPQGAVPLVAGAGEPGWVLEREERACLVAPPGTDLGEAIVRHVRPLLAARAPRAGAVASRTLRAAGVSPGEVETRLGDWLTREDDLRVSVLAGDGEVWLRVRARGTTAAAAAEALGLAETRLAALLGADGYGRDADTLEAVLGRTLVDRGLTLSVAESCTGGLVGHRLTSVPGSSAWFERGVVVYSNRAKQELLGVSGDVLRTHGAVSAPCAEAMARGIAERSGSPCGLAITGIAGPDGGTATKPVGTVFVGVAVPGRLAAHRLRLRGDRGAVKRQSAQAALDLLRRALADTGP